MVDTVSTQLIINGYRNLVLKFTDESDGTGESAITKVDATSATYAVNGVTPGIHLKIARVLFSINSGAVRLKWVASSATDALILTGFGTLDYSYFGGIPNPNNSGATGSIAFTTVGFVAGSSYDITLEMIKGI